MRVKFAVLFIGLFAFLIVPSTFAQTKAQKSTTIKLYFWPKDDDTFEAPALVEVTRQIKPTKAIANAAFRELLKGVTPEEKARGLESDYAPSQIVMGGDCENGKKMKPLLDYYLGMSIRRGVATVNFREPAMCYLNSTAAMQSRVKLPMEKTLMQFKTIKEWKIAINGKVVDEWDA